MRRFIDYIGLMLKGMAMGAADVIPGVSGGTIAFISGIYEELIASIHCINLQAVKKLFKEGISSFWRHINGNFLSSVLLGIAISILTLARVITFLLENHPIPVWAFFFGLILGSVYFVGKKIKRWNAGVVIAGIVGVAVAYFITVTVPAETPEALWFVFISGFVAICAMILPGISGSFILLLLGKYQFILESLKELKVDVIAVFIVGCAAGILLFAQVINWLFKHFHDLTVALLAGFMLGSLNKVWPWKEALEYYEKDGKLLPLVERSISPFRFETLTGESAQLILAIGLAAAGLVIIALFEIASRNSETKEV
jgi:putative membrane protein